MSSSDEINLRFTADFSLFTSASLVEASLVASPLSMPSNRSPIDKYPYRICSNCC